MRLAVERGRQGRTAASWAWAVPALVLAGAAAFLGFRAPLTSALETWSRSPSFEHGYAIVAVAAALIWVERRRLARETPRASIPGVLLALAAAALGAVGAAATVLVVEQIALVLFLHAMVLAILGQRIWRALAFPLAYLFFAVPIGDVLVPWLRDLAAHAIVAMLHAAGTPAVLDGYLIRLPTADYRVAEACSGLRFLLVSVAASVLAAHLLMHEWRRRLPFLAIAVALPLAANALRSVILIWLAAQGTLDPEAAALHLTYGLGFTGVLLALLMLLAWAMRQPRRRAEPVSVAPRRPGAPLPMLAAAMAVSLLALLPGVVTAAGTTAEAAPVRLTAPSVRGGWAEVRPSPELLETAALAGADANLAAAWSGETSRIELLVLYYERERQGAEAVGATALSASESSWTEVGQRPASLTLGDIEIRANGKVQERAGERRIVWTWYWVDGWFTANAVAAKLAQIGPRLLARPSAAARLQLTLHGEGAFGEPQAVLDRFLTDLEPIGAVLQEGRVPAP